MPGILASLWINQSLHSFAQTPRLAHLETPDSVPCYLLQSPSTLAHLTLTEYQQLGYQSYEATFPSPICAHCVLPLLISPSLSRSGFLASVCVNSFPVFSFSAKKSFSLASCLMPPYRRTISMDIRSPDIPCGSLRSSRAHGD